jgi:hypothetical protein
VEVRWQALGYEGEMFDSHLHDAPLRGKHGNEAMAHVDLVSSGSIVYLERTNERTFTKNCYDFACDNHDLNFMYSQRPTPPSLKRSYSGESQNSHGSAVTTVSRASSKLLFGEIPLTPATTVDGRCKTPSWHCAGSVID